MWIVAAPFTFSDGSKFKTFSFFLSFPINYSVVLVILSLFAYLMFGGGNFLRLMTWSKKMMNSDQRTISIKWSYVAGQWTANKF